MFFWDFKNVTKGTVGRMSTNKVGVRHVAGTGSGVLGGIPRVVVQISALTLQGPL